MKELPYIFFILRIFQFGGVALGKVSLLITYFFIGAVAIWATSQRNVDSECVAQR